MGAAGPLLAVSGMQAASGIGNAYAQSQAIKAQGAYQENIARINQRFAETQSNDALKRGKKEESLVKSAVKQTIGSQRAAIAGQGISLDSDTASQIIEDTRLKGSADIQTIKNNAWREAWGYKVQALGASIAGEWAGLSSRQNAKNTLITGGLNAVSGGVQTYAAYKKG